MTEQTVRHDLEGELIQMNAVEPTHYGKRLPLDIAWHFDDPKDLVYSLEPLVTEVHQNLGSNTLTIHYNPLIKPLNAQQLRDMIRWDGPLAAWRFAKLAVDLCKWLDQFHAAGIPQLFIHPERVAVFDSEFVLLPTLAGVLPPFSTMLSEVGKWLYYLAPEVLRTRGNDPDLLCKGDVYALGKTLHRLADPGWQPGNLDDLYALVEELVERPALSAPLEWPTGLETMQTLVARMCAFLPEERPSTAELLSELHLLTKQLDVETSVLRLISDKRLAVARQHLEDLQASQQHSVFDFPRAKIHLLYAKTALASSTPKYTQAIDQFKKALDFEPKNASIYVQIAHTYLQFTQHPQHLLLAEHAYGVALRLSDWREDIEDEWLGVLRQLEPKDALTKTSAVPRDKRLAAVFALRATSFQAVGQPVQAWHECADYFEKFGFSPGVYETAKAAADSIEPLSLIKWKHERQGADKLYASLSIVWARNGNLELAAECLARALGQAGLEASPPNT